MEKVFNLTSTFKSHTDEDGSVMIRGMASTAEFDRAGDSISADAWTKGGLNNFEKNPIILFNHDYSRPIGRAKKVTATNDGLHLEAKISKSAGDVAELVKDGVLGAFSVGFRVKDADYVEETDGLKIKDAELFEVSVVSVPCNQSATFSLAKSFDSMAEYEEFKKTFTNSDGAQVQKEITMSEETQQPVDLEAFAKKVAEETAAKIAMKQAEQKAADEAVQKEVEEKAAADAEAQAQQEEKVQSAIKVGVESGAERLVKDVEAKLAEKDAKMDEVLKQHEADLKEKAEEIEKMVQDAEANAEDDKKFEELVKTKNNADMLVHATRKTIDESGDALNEDEKNQVEDSVKSLEDAIASEKTEDIESATKNLNDVLTPLTQKLYKQENAEGQSEAQTDNEDSSENTVDAEFEEVKEEDK